MTAPADESTFRVRGRIVVRRIGDELLLVPVSGPAAGARVFPVNETALIVWSCLSEGGNVRQASERLLEKFEGVSRDEALADCEACVRGFVEEALMERVPAP